MDHVRSWRHTPRSEAYKGQSCQSMSAYNRNSEPYLTHQSHTVDPVAPKAKPKTRDLKP